MDHDFMKSATDSIMIEPKEGFITSTMLEHHFFQESIGKQKHPPSIEEKLNYRRYKNVNHFVNQFISYLPCIK